MYRLSFRRTTYTVEHACLVTLCWWITNRPAAVPFLVLFHSRCNWVGHSQISHRSVRLPSRKGFRSVPFRCPATDFESSSLSPMSECVHALLSRRICVAAYLGLHSSFCWVRHHRLVQFVFLRCITHLCLLPCGVLCFSICVQPSSLGNNSCTNIPIRNVFRFDLGKP